MADFGQRIRNGINEVQIDSTFKNLALRMKGTAVASSPWFHVNYRQVIVSLPASSGMIAYRANGPCCIYGMDTSGGTLKVAFLTYKPSSATPDITVNWYLFDEPGLVPVAPDYGRRVRNSSGVVTYDSRLPYMKFNAFLVGTDKDLPSTSSGLSPNFTYWAYPGILPAIVQGNLVNSQTEVPVGVGPNTPWMQFRFWQMMVQNGPMIGSTICVEDYGPSSTPSGWLDVRRQKFSMSIVDVSDL
ncbi:hypothetical protein I6I07_19540 [Achromobacter deleyi]|uniref:Uncharacterized protein n=2 Tax=Achromobacter TaxID=222 RepID=A0A7T4E1N2_9BURK|nr:hypothetical protein AL504_31850 [Achromobacter xylosoxidans]QQB32840.1 hypothetical protein I6I07_19540 [Achromobacter deleyi]